jgi:mRNA-degrading endonuclease toxin of MazEF toxin-antitoxin module
MLRGEVWWVDFDPSLGGEIQKRTGPRSAVPNC